MVRKIESPDPEVGMEDPVEDGEIALTFVICIVE